MTRGKAAAASTWRQNFSCSRSRYAVSLCRPLFTNSARLVSRIAPFPHKIPLCHKWDKARTRAGSRPCAGKDLAPHRGHRRRLGCREMPPGAQAGAGRGSGGWVASCMAVSCLCWGISRPLGGWHLRSTAGTVGRSGIIASICGMVCVRQKSHFAGRGVRPPRAFGGWLCARQMLCGTPRLRTRRRQALKFAHN